MNKFLCIIVHLACGTMLILVLVILLQSSLFPKLMHPKKKKNWPFETQAVLKAMPLGTILVQML